MRGALLFVCLLFLLVRGLESSGSPISKTSHIPVNLLEQTRQVNSSGSEDSHSFVLDAQLVFGEQLLVEDYEDEKNNRSFVLKQPLWILHHLTLPEAFHFNYLFGSAQETRSYAGHLPEIYITQRSLRI